MLKDVSLGITTSDDGKTGEGMNEVGVVVGAKEVDFRSDTRGEDGEDRMHGCLLHAFGLMVQYDL